MLLSQYELALHKDRASDPQVLACLGRVWLQKGKQDRDPTCMKHSLDYSRRALALAPSQIHFKFNIAFVQIQLAQLIYTIPEPQRTLLEVQHASDGLDEAIITFTEIANSKNPPYPKHDLEQRANMGRNTMRRQLDRAMTSQRDYEEKNATRLQEAREQREADLKRREEARLAAASLAAEGKRKLAEDRSQMLAKSRELAEQRAEEERRIAEAEMTTDSETGERVKRKRKARAPAGSGKRKKKGDTSDTETGVEQEERPKRKRRTKKDATESSAISSSEGGAGAKQKKPRKRKLARKGGKEEKFKSSEMVVDSDDEGDVAVSKTVARSDKDVRMEDDEENTAAANAATSTNGPADAEDDDDEEEEEAPTQSRSRKNTTRNRRTRIEESDDEDDLPPSPPPEQDSEDEDLANEPRTTAEQAARDPRGGNAFADVDVSMVDESVGAAGGANTAEYSGGGLGEAYGEGKEGLGTGDRQ